MCLKFNAQSISSASTTHGLQKLREVATVPTEPKVHLYHMNELAYLKVLHLFDPCKYL